MAKGSWVAVDCAGVIRIVFLVLYLLFDQVDLAATISSDCTSAMATMSGLPNQLS